jgi:hypothetical protein
MASTSGSDDRENEPDEAPTEQVDAPDEPSPKAESAGPIGRGRRILVQAIIWGTTLLAIIGIFAIWANRQVFNSDNWAKTSSRLLEDPKIRAATASYLVDQLYQNVNVAQELQQRLPKNLKPVAQPLAGVLQNAAVTAANRALANPKVQQVWRQANKAADQTLISIVNGGKGAVNSNNGVVQLDLSLIIKNITQRLGLPDISGKLPPNVAHLTVLKSDQLSLVQNGGKAVKGLALLLTILVPLLYALALLLARGRRRKTLLTIGIAGITAGIIVLAGRSLVESQSVNALVKNPANLDAARRVLSIATSMLSEIAGAFVLVGFVFIVAAWFAGPSRLATRGRKLVAPVFNDEPLWAFGFVALIMVLVFIWRPIPSTAKVAGVIVYFALAMFGTEILRRQCAQEFPDAHLHGHEDDAAPAPA